MSQAQALWAYVDPGSGLLVWQALVAAVIGLLFYLKKTRDFGFALLRRLFGRDKRKRTNRTCECSAPRDDVHPRFHTWAQGQVTGADTEPVIEFLVEVEAAPNLDGPPVVQTNFPVMWRITELQLQFYPVTQQASANHPELFLRFLPLTLQQADFILNCSEQDNTSGR